MKTEDAKKIFKYAEESNAFKTSYDAFMYGVTVENVSTNAKWKGELAQLMTDILKHGYNKESVLQVLEDLIQS